MILINQSKDFEVFKGCYQDNTAPSYDLTFDSINLRYSIYFSMYYNYRLLLILQ